MNKLHLKKLGLIFCMAVMPLLTHAASLGKLSVYSSLGDPLNAEIAIFSDSADELDSLSVALASDAVYREQGVERTAAQSEVKLAIVKKEGGSVVLKLNSAQPVLDPFLDMIIVLTWKDGSLSREYTVLLDPPTQASVTVDNATVDVPKPIIATKEVVDEKQDSVTVKKGDSLTAIAKRMQAPGVALNQLLVGLYLENKQAFDGDNINRLKIGALLKAPSQETLATLAPQDVQKVIQIHSAEWAAYKSKLAGTVAANDGSESADSQVTSGAITTKSNEKPLSDQESSRDVIKLSKSAPKLEDQQSQAEPQAHVDALKDDLTAKQNAISDTDEKSDVLEGQIAEMKQLLAIKNKSLADAQNNAPGAAKTPEVLTLLDTINPKVLKIAAGILALFLLIFWLRRRTTNEKALPTNEGASTEPLPVTAPTTAAEEDVLPIKSLDLSSISLDFEPVVTPVETGSAAEPIPDAFNGDFSNLLKIESVSAPVKPTQKASATRGKTTAKVVDFSNVETKFELAIAYIDMHDKRGAKKLLNEVLKEGDDSQKVRAQALIDQLK